MREIINPTNKEHWLELRKQDVTSTDVSALFGLSPYLTAFELWHRKKSNADVLFEETDRMKWGSRLESAIAQGIAEDNNLEVKPMKEYVRLKELKMGSSFDFQIIPHGILEIKNVDALQFKDGWIVDGDNIEAPPHIELQVQHQLAVSGKDVVFIGALIGGNNVVLIKREPDREIIDQIKERVFNFWTSIEKNREPKPDFEKDAEFIKSIYQKTEPGKIITATPQIERLANNYKSLSTVIKDATDKREAIKAEMLTLIGEAEKCKGEAFSISATTIKETPISYIKKSYRDFRVNFKKEKEGSNG